MIKKRTILGPLLALGLGLSACGDDDVTPVDGGMDAGDSGDTNNNMSMCSGATVIGCGTDVLTTITGNTSGGTTNFNTYCGQDDIYLGEENIFEMVNDSPVFVVVSATADSDEPKMDLYAFTSDAQCSSSETCIGRDTSRRATDIIGFAYQPGSNTFIGYDTFNEAGQPAGGTTSYSMTVNCLPIATQVTGTLDNTDVAWTRPSAGCEAGETMNHFELVEYTNESGSDQLLYAYADYNGYRGSLFRYDSRPDGSMPVNGCVEGNDAGRIDENGESGSGLNPFTLAAGETAYFAISSYDPEPDGGVYGDFNFTAFIFDGCGNGVVEPGFEACDDGNTTSGDGCDALCQIEGTSFCSGSPSVCEVGVCGDNMVTGAEVCDDGNTDDTDGCSCRTIDISGMLTSTDMTWNRANAQCMGSTMGNFYYDVVEFEWNGADGVVVGSRAYFGDDGSLHIFNGFDASMPEAMCLAGNIAADVSAETPMMNGQTYQFVLSTAMPNVETDWRLFITHAESTRDE